MDNLQKTVLASIAGDDLVTVTGGDGTMATVRRVGGKIAGKALPIVNLGLSGKDGYDSYNQARSEGKGVGASLWEGTKSGVSSFTGYDLWGPVVKEAFGTRPAY